MTARTKGDYFERQTRAALQARGWWVIRSGGSLGEADLVALRAGNRPLLVSCKLDGRLPSRQKTALLEVAHRTDASPVLADRPERGWVRFSYLLEKIPDGWELDTLKVPRGTVRG